MKKIPSFIHFTDRPAALLENLIENWSPGKVAVLVDENTRKHCLPLLNGILADAIIEIQSGETNKNLESCTHIWQELTSSGFGRDGLLVNLGGGVIGDMGGFCASAYKRGIRFINIPTTLLSQVDASIGGKLGVDFSGFKNHIGFFRNPDAVIICQDFLTTLPQRELQSGFAEVIKHALIRDKNYWDLVRNINISSEFDFAKVIEKSVEIKNEVVLSDPTEKGLRKILNFGHTIGHAIESWNISAGLLITHGEAIVAGMLIESKISQLLGILPAAEFEEIEAFLVKEYEKVKLPPFEELHDFMAQDKKNTKNTISFSLLNGIGECSFDQQASAEVIEASCQHYLQL